MSYDDFMRHMMRDKKVLAGQLRLILPTSIGSAQVISTTPESVIKQAIEVGKQ
jgi:3-dehydroquinate synthase